MTSSHMRVLSSLNTALDRVPRTDLRLCGRHVPAYGLGVGFGVISSVALIEGLAFASGLPVRIATASVVCALFTAIALAVVTKAMTGAERFTYYHYAVAVVTGVALMLAAIGAPVLPYLDLIALGLALCLTTGRVGCLMAGCCHGRPSGWGIRYGHAHAKEGFSPHLVGVRLLPLQAIEAGCIGSITVIGAAMVLRGAPAGSALAWSAVAYSVARFCLEFLRGDCERPHLLGVPEAHWTAVLLAGVVVWGERASMLPVVPWHGPLAAGLTATLLVAVVSGRWARTAPFGLVNAWDLRELAAALDRLAVTVAEARGPHDITVESTSAGLLISGGHVSGGAGVWSHYSVSRAGSRLSARGARRMARLIHRLNGSTGAIDFIRGGHGTFHVVAAGPVRTDRHVRRPGETAAGSSPC